ncbi:MAG: MogA/MoaB family molybdenum cofactor biosynthesis protein [Propionicimonas sp.]|uniref:MogA/MoaB family molybdenum cofactor biosynthesis protein n=1 Tax=Propionicimonas sp. TaxID=1955623 RepID=UPI002B2181B0|nr:MogA/MoaB family molybdenum cofactor biosynthesis protein [Propionicimonas sp.]MEA4945616.1 MogA/MoaB family molybdenum cofactor biosynthesis protein [Propionicimonas sp.]MEA5055028.1 MogA/MoaB family molybdenum cofactor biosynthesis protein [Propionicimonas sp.]MEA5118100.1 MogA/MoaB family molybdenum cofactor biosynthesis protein [Propionicimonas sp.]
MVASAVLTVSDRCAAGLAEDRSGPLLAQALAAAGHMVTMRVVPDGERSVAEALQAAIAAGARLIVTTGGTGVAPRDRTPEGTRLVVDRELPGVAESLRADGLAASPHAALGRGIAGVIDSREGQPGVFVVNLPGSPGAVRDGIGAVLALVDHVLAQLDGGDH